MSEYPKWDYQEYPKTLPRDDLWGQVRRTIYGRAPSDEEISSIIRQVKHSLDLVATDSLLDLGCGNGALSAQLFDDCAIYVGVDRSTYLIEIAKETFARPPSHVFINEDITRFMATSPNVERFTKMMTYAVLQYLDRGDVEELLANTRTRFSTIETVFIGNLPDREKADLFFKDGSSENDLTNPRSQIGMWWDRQSVAALGEACGWEVTFSQLPPGVFNSGYRFDAILTRKLPSGAHPH